jgi:hypothetical protein
LWCRSAVLFIAVLLAVPAGLRAEGYDLVPSLTVKEEYTDNLYSSAGSRTASFISQVSPRLELLKRDELTDGALLVGVDGVFYSADSDFVAALNQRYSGRLRRSVTPQLRLSGSGEYLLLNQPEEGPGQFGSVLDALRSTRQQYTAGLEYQVSERTRLSLAGNYRQEDYPSSSSSDNRGHGVLLTLEHGLDGVLADAVGRLSLGYNHYAFPGQRTDSGSALVGFGWSLNERWRLTVDAGGRYSRNEEEQLFLLSGLPVLVTESSSGFGWIARAALTVRGELQQGSLTLGHDVGLSSGRNGTAENTSLDLVYNRELSRNLRLATSAGYQLSRSSGSGLASSGTDEDYLRLQAALRYQVTRDTALELTYAYRKTLYRQTDTAAERNSIALSYTIRHPLLDRW